MDEGIAELIELIWRCGWRTVNSCQDQDGRVWLKFADAHHAEYFLEVVAGEITDENWSLYHCVTNGWVNPDDPQWDELERQLYWTYDAVVLDLHDIDNTLTGSNFTEPLIGINISIRFPHVHYPEVLERLRAHLQAVGEALE